MLSVLFFSLGVACWSHPLLCGEPEKDMYFGNVAEKENDSFISSSIITRLYKQPPLRQQ